MTKNTQLPASMEFYQDNTKLKWIILAVSVLISAGSIYYTNILVEQLKERERQQVELFAKALEYTLNSSEGNIVFIADEILFKNEFIPVIWFTKDNGYQSTNIKIKEPLSKEKKDAFLKKEAEEMSKSFNPIEIILKDPNTGEIYEKQYVYYKNSMLLTQLIAFPYICTDGRMTSATVPPPSRA